MKLDGIREKVFLDRYALKGEEGNLLENTPEEMWRRVAHDIVQQGGSRRGATMLMMHDWHPDVEEFITVKQDLSKIKGANLSVCVSDAFMEAVKADKDWDLVYPELSDPEYDEKWDGDIIG